MTIDWQALATRLSRPWWGPLHPRMYVYQEGSNKYAGVGLIVGQEYGTWNLTLMARGSYDNPTNRNDHMDLFLKYQQATKVAKIQVNGQPLSSYAMLMDPPLFSLWLNHLTNKELPGQFSQPLRTAMRIFLEKTKVQRV